MRLQLFEHDPVWVPTQLRFNAAGDTRPGFICAYEMENGNGQCQGNVFCKRQAVGRHACFAWVDELGDLL